MIGTLTLRLGLDPIRGLNEELVVFMLSVVLAARLGGSGRGLAATALGVPWAWFFFSARRYSFGTANPRAISRLILLAVGIGISLIVCRPQIL
jgi:K+-sensing histidine kinase KdpD